MYWASRTTKWFEENVDTLYYQYYVPRTAIFWFSVAICLIIGYVAYKISDASFESHSYDEVIENCKTCISLKKKVVKCKDYDQEEL